MSGGNGVRPLPVSPKVDRVFLTITVQLSQGVILDLDILLYSLSDFRVVNPRKDFDEVSGHDRFKTNPVVRLLHVTLAFTYHSILRVPRDRRGECDFDGVLGNVRGSLVVGQEAQFGVYSEIQCLVVYPSALSKGDDDG